MHQSLHPLVACFPLLAPYRCQVYHFPSSHSAPESTASFPPPHACGGHVSPHLGACSPAGAAAASAEPALLEQPAVAGTPADDRLLVQRLKHMSYNGQYDELFARPIDAKKPVRRG